MTDKSRDSHNHRGLIFIILGLLFISAALLLALYNRYDGLRAKESANIVLDQLEEYIPTETAAPEQMTPAGEQAPIIIEENTESPDFVRFPDLEMPVETIDGIDYIGVLEIPALELELPVSSQWSYSNLRISPCRYSGSAYTNNLILCGHNYYSQFGSLNQLRLGDLVTFTDINGNVFSYQVMEQETLNATDLSGMDFGDWDLTLFTCTVGGKARLTIRLELTEDQYGAQ